MSKLAIIRIAMIRLRRSWTVYFNALVAALLTLLTLAEAHFHLLRDALGSNWPYAMFALVMVNALLRLKTEVKHVKSSID